VTIICTILAIYASILVPGSVTGVSGLYISAAVYVPFALWFGIWGCMAGYLSCVFMGIYFHAPFPFVLLWALADFFEGFVPLMIYRSLKTRPVLTLKRPKLTYGLNVLLAAIFVGSAFAFVNSYTWAFIGAFAAAIVLVLAQGFIEDRKTWLTWLPVGVLLASVVSGIFGVGTMALFGSGDFYVPMSAVPAALYGWVLGDIIVLATIGTILTVAFTPQIVKARIYVKKLF
jgi:hypothetical protein